MKSNVVDWFEIYVDDMNRAQNFYESVLNLKMMPLQTQDAKITMVTFPWAEDMEAPNASGSLVKVDGIKAGGNSTMVYFQCEDCGLEQSRVETAGGKIIQPKFSIGEFGFCSVCMDTEGNTFGLHSMK
ncbi:MAG: VOC family protein [Bacteroidales bacterium]